MYFIEKDCWNYRKKNKENDKYIEFVMKIMLNLNMLINLIWYIIILLIGNILQKLRKGNNLQDDKIRRSFFNRKK